MDNLRKQFDEFLDETPKIDICGLDMRRSEALKKFKALTYEFSYQEWLEEKKLKESRNELLVALEEADSWFHDVRGYFTDDIRIEFDETCEKIKNTIKKANGE